MSDEPLTPRSEPPRLRLHVGGRFIVVSPTNDRYQSSRLPEVEIDIVEFWREVDRQMADD